MLSGYSFQVQWHFNSLRLGDTYKLQCTVSSLFQMMVCHADRLVINRDIVFLDLTISSNLGDGKAVNMTTCITH